MSTIPASFSTRVQVASPGRLKSTWRSHSPFTGLISRQIRHAVCLNSIIRHAVFSAGSTPNVATGSHTDTPHREFAIATPAAPGPASVETWPKHTAPHDATTAHAK